MNKRQRLADIRHKIFARALELFGDDMSFAEAHRQAAQQVATAEKVKPPRTKSVTPPQQPLSDGQSSTNLREELFSRIMSIKSRLPAATPSPAEENAPEGVVGKIARYLFREDDEPKPTPVGAKPTTVPSNSSYTEVWVGGAGRGVDLNKEFDGGPFCDNETTTNWRNSIEASKPVKRIDLNPVDATDPRSVELALQRQQAQIIPFRIMK